MRSSYGAFASLKYDFVFREVFSNERILRRFISDVTGIPLDKIKLIRIANPFLWKRYRYQKRGVMDAALILNDDTRIDIELQIRQQKYWVKRNLFYLAKMYTEDLKFGEDYSKLKKCIAISIVDFTLIIGGDSHSVYSLRDKNGKEFTDLFEIHIIELNKKWKEDDALGDWAALFHADTEDAMDRIATQIAEVQEAMEMVKTMNFTRSLRWIFEERQKARRDRWAEDEYVKDLGREEGRAEGAVIGIAMGKAEAIIQLIGCRFGNVPSKLQERISAERDVGTLDSWFRAAMDAGDLQEFMTKMEQNGQ